jgi:hypothetical protein
MSSPARGLELGSVVRECQLFRNILHFQCDSQKTDTSKLRLTLNFRGVLTVSSQDLAGINCGDWEKYKNYVSFDILASGRN